MGAETDGLRQLLARSTSLLAQSLEGALLSRRYDAPRIRVDRGGSAHSPNTLQSAQTGYRCLASSGVAKPRAGHLDYLVPLEACQKAIAPMPGDWALEVRGIVVLSAEVRVRFPES